VTQDQITLTWLFCEYGVACSERALASEGNLGSSVSAVTQWTAAVGAGDLPVLEGIR